MQGWTVIVLCPHEVKVQIPLRHLYSLTNFEDPCPQGRADLAAKKLRDSESLGVGRVKAWRERRRLARLLGDL